ncbi:tolloid-like protein 2 isoform X1 [Ptychodera flava]|uniref:tolloid-like protein 2 isoform X1 n=1 Tax=Ptychodera flava TaxID=63121 RepID=UPI00396A6ABB
MAASKYKGVRVLVAIICVTCLTLSHGREVDIHRTDVDSLTAYDKAKRAIGDCGGTFTSSSGTLTSPSYPFDYPNYADCYYSITVTQGYTIVLEFSLFVTEATFDTVEIFDGNSRYDTSLGEFSGSFINSQFTSSGRSLYIHFHSDGSTTASGFYATYRLGTQTSGYSLGDCGGTFTSDSGTLVSPSYPSHYSDSADCFYHISTSSGNTITIDISYVDTESCCDYVEVFDGTSRTATSLRRLSGSHISIDPITSSGSNLYIHFHSDSSMSDRGFYATYTVNNFGSSNAGVIAGSVVGCIIFIIIIIAIIVACCYYSPKSSKTTFFYVK